MAYKDAKTKKWIASILYTKLNGTSQRKRKYGFKTKKEAEQWERDNQNFQELNTKNPFMSQIFKDFLASKNGAVSQSTYNKNKTLIKLHLEPYLSDKKLIDINYHLIMKWRLELLEKGLSSQRVNQCVKFFKEIYNFTIPIYNINHNPFIQIKKLQEEEKIKIEFYTLEEFNKFIDVIDDIIYKNLFHVLYYCGLRKGELLALNWNDIDFLKATMNISKSMNQKLKGVPYFIGPPKNKSSYRVIKLDKKTLNNLKELKDYYKKRFRSFNNNDFVFGGSKPIAETTLTNNYIKYIENANLKKIRIHDFRHSNATLLINSGANAVLVAKRLGHSDVKMTLNTYSHLFENEEDKVINIIDKL